MVRKVTQVNVLRLVSPWAPAELSRETSLSMTYFAYLSAVLALLLAPGPTNTLMGIAGARGGLGASVRLLPAELAGYLTTILPLTWLGAELLARFPSASVTLKVVAAVAMLWGGFGRLTQAGDSSGRRLLLVQRAASVWLAIVSVTLMTGVLRA